MYTKEEIQHLGLGKGKRCWRLVVSSLSKTRAARRVRGASPGNYLGLCFQFFRKASPVICTADIDALGSHEDLNGSETDRTHGIVSRKTIKVPSPNRVF